MPNTPDKVEYQLQDISLSDGVNAKDRQENVDWTKYFTTLSNLVNDDDKCYVKRSGITTAGTTDDSAVAYGPCYRLLNVRESACAVGNKFNLWSYNTASAKMVKKGQLPLGEFAVTPFPVDGNGKLGNLVSLPGSGTGGTADGIGDTAGRVLDSCISTKYAVVMRAVPIVSGTNFSDPSDVIVSVIDRNTRDVVRRYNLSEGALGGGTGASTFSDLDGMARCTFVDDRYLHILYFAGGNQKILQVDTNSLPATLSGTTWTVVNTLAAATTAQKEGIVGLYPMAGKSVIVLYSNVGSNSLVYTFSTGGVLSASLSIAAWPTGGCDVLGTDLYTVAVDATPKFVVKKIDCTTSPPTVTSTLTDGSVPNVVPSTTAPPPRIAVTSTGVVVIIGFSYQASITANVNCPVIQVLTASAGSNFFKGLGVITDWVPGTHPFCDRSTDKIYIGLIKLRRNNAAYTVGSPLPQDDTGAFIVFDIGYDLVTSSGSQWIAGTSFPDYAHPFRPAANIDPLYVTRNVTNVNANVTAAGQNPYFGEQVVQKSSDGSFMIGVECKSSGQSRIYWGVELKPNDPSCLASAGELISGGVVSTYDGTTVSETGFVDSPNVYLADSGVAGGPAAGLYNYVAVYNYTDCNGRIHYSRTSRVSTLTTGAANKINVQVTAPVATREETSAIDIRIYRTPSGGTVFYYVASVQVTAPSGALVGGAFCTTYADTTTDANLIKNPVLFRNPGTTYTALDRFAALCTNTICRHKDRIFTAYYNTVYYSSFFVDGEAPWFNPSFSFPVYGGSGPITAIASMDGQLVVFKRDAIFVVDGDGPPENGGNGTEFSPPRRINTEFGCIDQRTVVATPDGLMYRSPRGIELLTRSMQISFAGEMVKGVVDNYPYCSGSAFDRRWGRVYFVMATSLTGTQNNYTAPGKVLVYDYVSNSWYSMKYYNQNAVGNAMQDVLFMQLYPVGTNDPAYRLMFSTANEFHIENVTNKTDNGTFAPFVMETGWIKIESVSERIRVAQLLLTAKSVSNHAIKISVAYDYSSTYSDSTVFQPDKIPTTLEQLIYQIPAAAKMAVRIKIEDMAPNDTTAYPVGNGNGPEIFGVTVKLAKRGGGAKIAAEQKG